MLSSEETLIILIELLRKVAASNEMTKIIVKTNDFNHYINKISKSNNLNNNEISDMN